MIQNIPRNEWGTFIFFICLTLLLVEIGHFSYDLGKFWKGEVPLPGENRQDQSVTWTAETYATVLNGYCELYKCGMVRVDQVHKLQEFFQTDQFLSEFSRYDIGTAEQAYCPLFGFDT